jgi:hypothetical protein
VHFHLKKPSIISKCTPIPQKSPIHNPALPTRAKHLRPVGASRPSAAGGPGNKRPGPRDRCFPRPAHGHIPAKRHQPYGTGLQRHVSTSLLELEFQQRIVRYRYSSSRFEILTEQYFALMQSLRRLWPSLTSRTPKRKLAQVHDVIIEVRRVPKKEVEGVERSEMERNGECAHLPLSLHPFPKERDSIQSSCLKHHIPHSSGQAQTMHRPCTVRQIHFETLHMRLTSSLTRLEYMRMVIYMNYLPNQLPSTRTYSPPNDPSQPQPNKHLTSD